MQVGVVSLCSAAWAVSDAGGSLSEWVAAAAAGLHHQAVLGAVLWTGLVTTALCSEHPEHPRPIRHDDARREPPRPIRSMRRESSAQQARRGRGATPPLPY